MDGHEAEPRMANSGSLIDLSANPGPPDAEAVSQTQPASSTTNIGNLASGELLSESKASHSPSSNFFDSLLSELSAPAVVPIHNIPGGLSSGNLAMTHTVAVSSTLPPLNMLELPNNNGAPISTSMVIPSEGTPAAPQMEKLPMLAGESGDPTDKVPPQLQLPYMKIALPSAFPSVASGSTSQQTFPLGGILQSQVHHAEYGHSYIKL